MNIVLIMVIFHMLDYQRVLTAGSFMSSVDVNVKSVATASYVFGNELKLRGEAKLVVQLFDDKTQLFFWDGVYKSIPE